MRRLGPGDVAPPFTVTAISGHVVTAGAPAPVGDAAPGRTLLVFLRYASCPMCNLRVRELHLAADELEARRVRVVAVMHSPARRIVRHNGNTFAGEIIADPARTLYRLYRAEKSWLGMLWSMLVPSFYVRFVEAMLRGFWGGWIDGTFASMPAEFLITPEGRIEIAHYGRHIGDHLPLASIGATNRGEVTGVKSGTLTG